MKSTVTPNAPNPFPRWFTGGAGLFALALFLAASPGAAQAQSTPNPPDRMTYQGYLVDANGDALGVSAPKNYDVIFRLWNDQNSTDPTHRLWAEQQTVTVDKGYFSVLLGEGSQYSTEPHPSIASLFSMPDASDRYVEITVKGIGSGGSDVTILPRLRLLTSPYSFLAQKAVMASTLVNNTNGSVVSVDGTTLNVNGTVAAGTFSGSGANLSNLDGANLQNGSVTANKFSSDIGVWTRSSPNVSSYGGSLYLANANIFMDNSFGLFARNAAGTYEQWMWPRWSDNATYLNYGKNGFHIRNSSSSDVMFMADNGSIGIGTTSPAGTLHVTSGGWPTEIIDGTSTAGTWLDLHNSSSGGQHWHIISTGSGNGEGAGKLLFAPGDGAGSVSGREVLTLTPSGAIGIGTAYPKLAELEIRSSPVQTSLNNYAYLTYAQTAYFAYPGYINLPVGYITSGSGNFASSIYADGRISCPEFDAFSDARMKRVEGISDSRRDLTTLMGIKITDYTMVDTVADGSRHFKKVIAQQVEKVYPQAVNETSGVVPDIYVKSEARRGWIGLEKPLSPPLKVGDKIRLVTGNDTATHEVTEVDGDRFRVKEPLDGPVFVYGREVSDVRTVDYDALSMLNVSATQELYRELQAKDAELRQLRSEVDELAEREKAEAVRFDRLESLVNRLSPPIQKASLR